MPEEITFNQISQTKGSFEAKGVLFGLKSENLVKTSDKGFKMMNLGLRLADGEVMYLSLNGGEQKFVYFSKMGAKGEKPVQEKVEWEKRNRFNKDGYNLIGVRLGLTKNEETGKNELVTKVAYDAIEYIEENAEDGMSVFVKGQIEFGSYEKNEELKKTVKFVPNAIYLAGQPIDFQDEKFEKYAEFAQKVVYKGVRREKIEKSEEYNFYADVALIGYRTYEETSLEITKDLAAKFKDNLKPNTGIVMTGKLKSSQVVETVTAEVWGEDTKVGKPKNTGRTVLFVDGAQPATIDTETYKQKVLDAYIGEVAEYKKAQEAKKAGFASQEGGDWGNKSKVDEVEEVW